MVSCGEHRANSCRECPRGKGEQWCHGDCVWMVRVNHRLTHDGGITGDCLEKMDTDVSCGRHVARNCSACTQGQGASWCNGNCTWLRGACVSHSVASKDLQQDEDDSVSCGSHAADSCSECPQGHGETWCNGECIWFTEECVERARIRRVAQAASVDLSIARRDHVSCGEHHNATQCSDCQQGYEKGWCHGDCVWFEDECVETSGLERVETPDSGRTRAP